MTGLLITSASAQIVTDGSVGSAQNLSGPDFLIPEDLGTRAGGNLFHSFQHFNILTGQSATFSGTSEIANVISRVTGGNPSTIDGVLRSTIGQADFYFLNPAGVLFGAEAQVDVLGSFYASTADQLSFADGGVYDAKNPNASRLSFDQPASFGFLGDQTGRIRVVGSTLVFAPGETFSLSAGELEIENTQIFAEQGDIQLVAIGDAANTVTMEGNLSVSARGKLSMRASGIDASGDGAGSIAIRSGATQIILSGIFADNDGSTDAGSELGIDIRAVSLVLDSSFVDTNTFGVGKAANLSMNVAADLSIMNGSQVSSNTSTIGQAGQINVTAGTLTVDGQGNQFATGIFSQAKGDISGDAGAITVTVDNAASIVNGGEISSSTFGGGDADQTQVSARTLTIDGQGSDLFTGIASQANPESTGTAGTVTVAVDDVLSIVNEGQVSTSTFGTGNAGQVDVTAGALMINGQSNGSFTGIASQAGPDSSGQAGSIRLDTQNLSIIGGGTISVASFPTVNTDMLATIKPTDISISAENISLRDSSIVTRYRAKKASAIRISPADYHAAQHTDHRAPMAIRTIRMLIVVPLGTWVPGFASEGVAAQALPSDGIITDRV